MNEQAPTPLPPPEFRGRFLHSPTDKAPYGTASGILATTPSGVAIPADRDDLASLVRWASETRTPLIPRSAGTGMPGGNVGSGVAVDLLTPFRSVTPPQADAASIRVDVGATLAEVNAACRPLGLHFPVDPSSGERCTIGGMLANNSGGPHSVRYGSVRRWVREVEVILADGTHARAVRGATPQEPRLDAIDAALLKSLEASRAEIERRWPRVRKNSSGYALHEYLHSGDIVDLIVGSEGTLALMVSAVLDLAPLPRHHGLVVLEFTDLEAAGAAVWPIVQENPATCEMLDRTFLELVQRAGRDDGYPLRSGLEAILLVEVDGDSEAEVADAAQRVVRASTPHGGRSTVALSPEAQARIWTLRRAASPIIAEQAGRRVSMQFIEDSVLPVHRLAEYVRGLRYILSRHELPAVIFGHAGDANLHVNPLVDVHAPRWRQQLETVLDEVADLVVHLGGTLSGEHGDGRLRAPLLERIWGPDLVGHFRTVKKAFDPLGILNPGVILPLPGQRPFEAIRTF